jgi:membrane protease YdiL (CAAX protease family)
MKRLPKALRPILLTLLLAALAAFFCLGLIEQVYEVPLQPRSFRFERTLAACLVAAGLLVLIARGYVQKKRRPRL